MRKITFVSDYMGKLAYMTQESNVAPGPLVEILGRFLFKGNWTSIYGQEIPIDAT
jgi:hypothetical protein